MGRKPKIATEAEVLTFLTDVMRRDTPEDVKISEAMTAADKLIKYLKDTADNEPVAPSANIDNFTPIDIEEQDLPF